MCRSHRARAHDGGFTIIEALVSAALVFGAIAGGIELLSGVERASRSLESRDRIYHEASRIADRLRADLGRADATPFLESNAPSAAIEDPLPSEDDPATLLPVNESRSAGTGSPFDRSIDAFATLTRSGEGDSLYFRTRIDEGDRCVPANVLWRVVFRDENRNGSADPGERRLERIVLPLGPSGLDAARVTRQILTSRLVHFRVSYFDAEERRYVDAPITSRRFGYPPNGVALGNLTAEGVLTCDAVADDFAELRRGDEVWLEPTGLSPGLYPIADSRAGRLLFRLPGRPQGGPIPFRAAYLPIAIRATFAIEGDGLEADQLRWSMPSDVHGRTDRRAIVRSFAVTIAMRGSL
ncbi:MAG: hypothetical protein HYR85_27610 [Planctomycetes bacterium]|nr:hypothetical protein [Planctomycetota bacterium]MBI3844252.1 hypothetical protein [Planctomycetota bacterium]